MKVEFCTVYIYTFKCTLHIYMYTHTHICMCVYHVKSHGNEALYWQNFLSRDQSVTYSLGIVCVCVCDSVGNLTNGVVYII